MFKLFLIFAFYNAQAACLPERLDFESIPLREVRYENVDRLEDFERTYDDVLRKSNLELDLIYKTNVNRTNAEVDLVDSKVLLTIYGGMLRHQELNPQALILLLCHEIGHVLGGEPLKSKNGWSSTEGQSDYYSTKSCFKDFYPSFDDLVVGAQGLTKIYSDVTGEAPPRIDRCEQRVASRTIYGYPSLQCRMDTLFAGWENKPRPSCWFID